MPNEDSAREAFYGDARHDGVRPLEGLRVVEVTTTWSGPRCGGLLAEFGADVIKVESRKAPDVTRQLPPIFPVGESNHGHLDVAANCGKRNLSLDLRRDEGRSVFHRLVATSDIVVENLKPGAMDGWECGYKALRKVRADLVFVSISGFGQYGPYRDRGGYDPIAQAMSGFMWLNGADGTPAKAPYFLGDELSAHYAVMGALAAIRHRDRTGEGQHVDISLFDSMIASSTGIGTQVAQDVQCQPTGNAYSFAVPANAYECSDGWVYAGALTDGHWRILTELMGKPEYGTDERYATIAGRLKHREALDALMSDWCRPQTREAVVTACCERGLTAGSILTPNETVDVPHIAGRGTFADVPGRAGGTARVVAPVAHMSRTPLRIDRGAPSQGADSVEILTEIGLSADEIQRLRDDDVV